MHVDIKVFNVGDVFICKVMSAEHTLPFLICSLNTSFTTSLSSGVNRRRPWKFWEGGADVEAWSAAPEVFIRREAGELGGLLVTEAVPWWTLAVDVDVCMVTEAVPCWREAGELGVLLLTEAVPWWTSSVDLDLCMVTEAVEWWTADGELYGWLVTAGSGLDLSSVSELAGVR